MDEQKFSLKWNSYQSSVTRSFDELRRGGELVDVTLCCEGAQLHVHRIILSVCSPYFRNLLNGFDGSQRVVFHMRETSAADLCAVVEFIYTGRASVSQSRLSTFLRTAELLQIRGLTAADDDTCDTTPPPASRSPPSAETQHSQIDFSHSSAPDPSPARVLPADSAESLAEETVSHAVETVTLISDDEKPKLEPDLHQLDPPYEAPLDQSDLQVQVKEEPDCGAGTEVMSSCLPPPPPLPETFREVGAEFTPRWSVSSASAVNSGGSTMYECSVCGKRYKHRDSLLHHRKKHEGLTTCQLCGKVCCIVAELRRHLIIAHSLSPQDIRRLVPSQRRWSTPSSWAGLVAENSASLVSRTGTGSTTMSFDNSAPLVNCPGTAPAPFSRETECASVGFSNHSLSTSSATSLVYDPASNPAAPLSVVPGGAPVVETSVDE